MRLIRNYYLNKCLSEIKFNLIERTLNRLIKSNKNFFHDRKIIILDDLIYTTATPEEYIASITKRICNSLGIATNKVVATFAFADGNAGIVSFVDDNCFVEINSAFKKNDKAVATIIAHELTHIWMKNNNFNLPNVDENERLTDIMSIFLGLGVIFLNGSYEKSSKMYNVDEHKFYHSEIKHYITSNDMGYAFALFLKFGKKKLSDIAKYCNQNTVDMLKIGNDIINRRKERLKDFIQIDTFIIYCPNCLQKLKITAEKKARVRCPVCNNIFEFTI